MTDRLTKYLEKILQIASKNTELFVAQFELKNKLLFV